jgi:acetylornithine/LysW-gamma-L-lysine aminotransferase
MTWENDSQWPLYAKRGIVLVRGENARVWDAEGNEYIDCVSGHGSMNIGHGNLEIQRAIARQAARMISCSNIFYNDTRAGFLHKLQSIAPPGLRRIFLCNSGSESIEAAIKFARYSTERPDIVCAVNGFHGRTLGALSATHAPHYRNGFGPLLEGFSFVPFNKFEKMEAAVDHRTAGVILEIVQGEGGVNPGNRDYFTKVQNLCRRQGVFFIVDEVQTGWGRTGKMFAIDHFSLQPDMVCLAKSIAGGLPMGAVLGNERIDLPEGKHGTTFGGNPLCCAAASAVIDILIRDDLPQQAADKGRYLLNKLKSLPLPAVRESRGLGLMIGLELRGKVKPYLLKLMDRGVLALPAGPSVLRLLPPLTISYEELDRVIEALLQTLNG